MKISKIFTEHFVCVLSFAIVPLTGSKRTHARSSSSSNYNISNSNNNSSSEADLKSSSSLCFVLLIRLALVSLLVSWLVCATRWSGQVSVAGGAGASCRSASAATRSCALKAASCPARLHLEPKHGAALAASATGHRDIEASATCAKAIGNGKRHRQQHRQQQQQHQHRQQHLELLGSMFHFAF